MQGGDNSSRDSQQQQQQNQNPPPPPPQSCPRCESTNTKFCYYNNYSVTQPRYFCKACRRYWTHGGTLRNIPVGGGVRKNKRSRPSSSASASSHLPPQPAPPLTPPPHVFPQLNLTNPAQSFIPSNPIIPPPQPPSIPSMRSNYYPGNGGGGFFPSLPFNNNQQPLDPSLNVPNHFGGAASNLGLLQGFSTNTAAIPSFGNANPMLMNAAQNDWNFINNVNPTAAVSDTALWGTATPSGGDGNTIGSASGGFNLNPNPWSDLPGYGPPQ